MVSVPTSVVNFTIADHNSTSVQLTWNYEEGKRNHVIIYYCLRSEPCNNITTNETTTIISDLTAGETYSFSITAVSNEVTSDSKTEPVDLGKIL